MSLESAHVPPFSLLPVTFKSTVTSSPHHRSSVTHFPFITASSSQSAPHSASSSVISQKTDLIMKPPVYSLPWLPNALRCCNFLQIEGKTLCQQKDYNLPYFDANFIAVVWNQAYNISKICITQHNIWHIRVQIMLVDKQMNICILLLIGKVM
uniref:Uncharacterized protein n=1 Tax=Rousettus aegyptiacus TaxID=9407 RepID=A0A7J8JGX3_ROUAE|nr:hypothetical protein HJG63_010163 [Rousettus aegyptiacus]